MSDVALRLTLDGAAQEIFVSTGNLQLRQSGPWLARELVCSSKTAPAVGSPATLVCHREDGADDTFVGTVRRATSSPGDEVLTVSLVAGAGKLLAPLPPLDHVLGGAYVPAGAIARAICDAAGETLADGVELALDVVLLPRWHRATDTSAAVALDILAWALSGAGGPAPPGGAFYWRVLPSGRVWLGQETWPAVAAAAYWTGLDPEDGVTTYAVRGAPFLPGQAVDGLRAVEVWYTLGESGLDARVRGAVPGDVPHVPDRDLYRASYSATVVNQRSDGTIDVRCGDARIGDLQRVAFRLGLPTSAAIFDPSERPPPRVRVAFEGASPAGAYAYAADQDPAASYPALRTRDTGGALAFDPGVPGTLDPALYYQPPGASELVPVFALPAGSTLGGTVPTINTLAFRDSLTFIVLGPGSQWVKLR